MKSNYYNNTTAVLDVVPTQLHVRDKPYPYKQVINIPSLGHLKWDKNIHDELLCHEMANRILLENAEKFPHIRIPLVLAKGTFDSSQNIFTPITNEQEPFNAFIMQTIPGDQITYLGIKEIDSFNSIKKELTEFIRLLERNGIEHNDLEEGFNILYDIENHTIGIIDFGYATYNPPIRSLDSTTYFLFENRSPQNTL